MNDNSIYKSRLYDYLIKKGVDINTSKKPAVFRCIAPGHVDNDPSCTIYIDQENQQANCNSCGFKGDIFDCAGVFTGSSEFPAQLEEVKSVLGDSTPEPIRKAKKKTGDVEFVSLPRDEALKIYNDKKVLEYADFVLNTVNKVKLSADSDQYKALEIGGFWPYYNRDGLIDLMVVRFDHEDRKKKRPGKDVLTYYWDGKHLKMKNYPVLLYNLDKMKDGPVLIHEGEKSVDAASELSGFWHTTWNGGGKKFHKIQGLEILAGREIYILGDDDKPGQETAAALRDKLKAEFGFDSWLVPPFEESRAVKKKGADIVEILQVLEPDVIVNRILEAGDVKALEKVGDKRQDNFTSDNTGINNNGSVLAGNDDNSGRSSEPVDCGPYPFQILGIADDGHAYFIDTTNRLVSYKTTSINDNVLCDMGTYNWFKAQNGMKNPTKEDWLQEVDSVRIMSKEKDFDTGSIRGRGAWRDSKGGICYHDGQKTSGNYDKDWTFVRRPKRDIGIHKQETGFEIRAEIMQICKSFSFKTRQDAIRLLAWSALAPFGGALKWRPAVLVTGESGTGKSTVLDNVVRPISAATAVSGTSTTEAGIRQFCGMDSNGVSVDEFDAKKMRDRERLEGILTLMRGSTTDDAPKSLKGTMSGAAMSFSMKSMFCFAAINPSVDNIADDNRIVRINFRRVNNFGEFTENLKRIKTLLCAENCQGIRAFVWNNLSRIIKVAASLEIIIQRATKQDARYAAGESILLAAHMIVWEGLQNFDTESLTEFVQDFYKDQEQEETRDETNELIMRLLDETIFVGEARETHSLRGLLIEMKKYADYSFYLKEGLFDKSNAIEDVNVDDTKQKLYRETAEHYGLTVDKKHRELFITQNHHQIMRIIEMGKGYHMQLARHKNIIDPKAMATIDKATKRGVVVGGFLGYGESQ